MTYKRIFEISPKTNLADLLSYQRYGLIIRRCSLGTAFEWAVEAPMHARRLADKIVDLFDVGT